MRVFRTVLRPTSRWSFPSAPRPWIRSAVSSADDGPGMAGAVAGEVAGAVVGPRLCRRGRSKAGGSRQDDGGVSEQARPFAAPSRRDPFCRTLLAMGFVSIFGISHVREPLITLGFSRRVGCSAMLPAPVGAFERL